MKRIILPALVFSAWMSFLNTDIPVGENFLPALGRFLNPYQGIWQSVVPELSSYKLEGKTKGSVRILFDDRDIPHIYADHLEDALYAQGYLHAANRLFAMDLTTRSASGRLSELIGPRTLEIDRRQRERGFEWSAQQKAESWVKYEGNQTLIDAYVEGVNDYIRSLPYKRWPVEYKILSHAPADWCAVHSALTLTSMAISLCLGEDDLEYSTAQKVLSAEDYAYLFPDHNPKESPIIPSDRTWDFTPVQFQPGSAGPDGEMKKSHGQEEQRDLNGSNNWAISPAKTANGFALLANDPHLGLTLPNIWYEMEIHTPEMSVHGVSIPGLPFIIIGFNEHIAWGSTNSGQDVLDWFVIDWEDNTRQKYLLDGEYVRVAKRLEEIQVRGSKSVTDTIRYTTWGPVTHTDEHRDMAMKWIGHQKATSNDLEYLIKINKARDIGEYREAVSSFQYPAQNKIFASTQGDVAISVAGVMPVRPDGLGETLTSGSKSANDWLGYIPFEQAPFTINPARKFVSSANQAPADPSYPYPMLGKRIFEDYRGRVINDILLNHDKFTPDAMKALQQNNYNLHAAEILPLLLGALASDSCIGETGQAYVQQLKMWNYEYHRDSIGPILFDLWYREFENMTWEELDSAGVMRPEEWRLIEIIQSEPDHKYFDHIGTPDQVETFSAIACASFLKMAEAFDALPETRKKNWGHYKHSQVPHLARFPNFGVDFIPASGGRHIVNAMSKTHGPSWRMIVELTSPPKAWVNYPGGQSGDPASPHYRDMLEHFFDGKYYEVSLKKNPETWTSTRQIEIKPK